MKLRLPFRHHELFYYNKKLFIHYFLVPGRQVPFLVRGGCGHPRPYRAIAYETKKLNIYKYDCILIY